MISQDNEKRYISKYTFTGNLYKKYRTYASYLNTLNITKDTKEWRLKHIRGFLYYLEENNIKLKNLKPQDVYNYMKSILNLKARTREHRAICIRFFLNWLNDNKIISYNGSTILPKIKCNKHENIVTYYSDEEITKILNSINAKEINGKRDLAILLLFGRFGLRQRDIMMLKLEDIKWNDNKIIIVQCKNKIINNYPMTEEIRYALLDYLKNERPESSLPYVFLKDSNNIYNDHFYYNLVNKYLKKANIVLTNKHHGTNIFRHSIATSIINDGYSIYVVSSILGHKNINEAMTYAKVDIKNLKKISLEVPLWEN